MDAKFNKCEFLLTEVRFLRHVVSALDVLVDPKNVKAVELGEAKVSLRDTQFLGIGRILQEVRREFLSISSTYDEIDPEGG